MKGALSMIYRELGYFISVVFLSVIFAYFCLFALTGWAPGLGIYPYQRPPVMDIIKENYEGSYRMGPAAFIGA